MIPRLLNKIFNSKKKTRVVHFTECRHEKVCNGKTYVMFEGRYNYTQAAELCDAEQGTLAMVDNDTDTFTCLYNIYDVYRNQGGDILGAFVDGSKGIMNQQSRSEWWCTSTQSECRQSIAWQPGQPDNQHCASILRWYSQGVGDVECGVKQMAMCQV